MSIEPTNEILQMWHSLLMEIELSKKHRMMEIISSAGIPAPNPLLDSLLPSLLYIKLVSLLEEILNFFIFLNDLTMPKEFYPNLYGKLDFLNEMKCLLDADGLHKIRSRRNELAHEIKNRATWEELNNALDIVEHEVQNMGYVEYRPNFEFFANRSRAKDSPKEDVIAVFDCSYGLTESGEIVFEVRWQEEVHRRTKQR